MSWMPRPPQGRQNRLLDDSPPHVVEVEPEDGASGVLRDTPLVLRLSRPVDPTTVTTSSVRVHSTSGAVPARLVVSPDRTMLVWVAQRLLAPRTEHMVRVEGVHDLWGTPVEPYQCRFVPGELSTQDWRDPV